MYVVGSKEREVGTGNFKGREQSGLTLIGLTNKRAIKNYYYYGKLLVVGHLRPVRSFLFFP